MLWLFGVVVECGKGMTVMSQFSVFNFGLRKRRDRL